MRKLINKYLIIRGIGDLQPRWKRRVWIVLAFPQEMLFMTLDVIRTAHHYWKQP